MPINYSSPLTPQEEERGRKLAEQTHIPLLPNNYGGRITGTMSSSNGIPEDQQYRGYRPNPLQRMYDNWMAEVPATQLAIINAKKVSPERYNQVTDARRARADEYPEDTFLDKAAGYVGRLGRHAGDTSGLTLSAATVGTLPVLAGGAMYGGGRAYLDDRAKGEGYDPWNIAAGATSNMLGGKIGDVGGDVIMPRNAGILGESIGRAAFGEIGQGFVEDKAQRIADATRSARDKIAKYFSPLGTAEAKQY